MPIDSRSRVEDILNVILGNLDPSVLQPPQSRVEDLLQKLNEMISDFDGKIPVHICTYDEYDHETLMPTIEDPNEDEFYLVPAEDSGDDMYIEWIFTEGNRWERFGSGGGSGLVSDVRIGGSTVVSQGIADIPNASNQRAGVVKIATDYGTKVDSDGLKIDPALSGTVKTGLNSNKPIVPSTQHTATFYGLAKAAGDSTQPLSANEVGTYTDSAKDKILSMLGVSDLIAISEGSTASKAYSVGEMFIFNGKLHEATDTIAIGDAIVSGINCDVVLLGDELTDLKSQFDEVVNVGSQSPNKYNPESEQPNTVISSTGGETPNSSYTLNTDYIPCTTGQYISCKTGDSTAKNGVAFIGYYKTDKSFIQRQSVQYGDVRNILNDKTDCAFIRVVVWSNTTDIAVYINDANPNYTDDTFVFIPYGTTETEVKYTALPESVRDAVESVDNIADSLDYSYRFTDLTETAELFTAAYIDSSGVITNSSAWNLFILQTSEIPSFSELTVKSYTNLTSRYQVAFYSSAMPNDATFIGGDLFTVSSSLNELVITKIPTGTVSILIANLIASGNISVVSKSAEEETAVDDLKKDDAVMQTLSMRERRARFDNRFNYIAYSAMLQSGKGPNSEEQYLWGAQRKFTSIKGDVRISSDNEIVMCHDDGFTLNGNGEVTAYDASNMTPIRNITAAQCYALVYEGTTDHVCGIDALVRTCKIYGKVAFITVRSSYLDEIFPKIFACLDKYSMREYAIINGFSYDTMKKARKYDKDIMLSWVVGYNHKVTQSDVDAANALGNCFITCFDYSGANPTRVSNQDSTIIQYAHDKDIRIYEAILGYDTELEELYDAGIVGCQIAIEPSIFNTFS